MQVGGNADNVKRIVWLLGFIVFDMVFLKEHRHSDHDFLERKLLADAVSTARREGQEGI
jgi:hypothetical protein